MLPYIMIKCWCYSCAQYIVLLEFFVHATHSYTAIFTQWSFHSYAAYEYYKTNFLHFCLDQNIVLNVGRLSLANGIKWYPPWCVLTCGSYMASLKPTWSVIADLAPRGVRWPCSPDNGPPDYCKDPIGPSYTDSWLGRLMYLITYRKRLGTHVTKSLWACD